MSLIFLSFQLNNASAEELCPPGSQVSPNLQDVLKITQKLSPATEVCLMRKACREPASVKGMYVSEDHSCEDVELMKGESKRFQLAEKCGLTLSEFLSISDYAQEFYACMNSYLRNKDNKHPVIGAYVALLNQALDKLPNYEGIVIRGATLPESVAAIHKKGNVVTYDAFTSATTNKIPWGKDVFIIISQTGKPIMSISYHKNESEVLFKSGTQFEILDVYTEDKVKYYVMKEINGSKTSSDQWKTDLKLVKKLKKQKEPGLPDFWSCSEVVENVPEAIKQKNFPSIK